MDRQSLLTAGYVLGFGMGGFFDGIVLHQLFQWHHYPTNTVAGLEINTLWNGSFYLAMYVVTVVGLVLLWRALMRKNRVFAPRAMIGAVLVGFGGFHLFDSIVNHWILQIHHIRMGPDALAYDVAFFVIGLILMALGWWLLRLSAGQPAT